MFLSVRALGVIAFAVSVTATGACAVISGLDHYWKADCTQNCDGSSVDARVAQEAEAKAPPGRDATTGVDTGVGSEPNGGAETSIVPETNPELDATSDIDATSMPDVPMEPDATSEPDVASEVDVTVDSDAAPEAAAVDSATEAEAAVLDAGPDCTPDTAQNCTACGTACDTAHSVGASCNGTTCLYSGCASGRLDCDRTPPNTNGCETVSSTANCGACGQACNTSTGTPSCLGTTCSYVSACNPGRSDCNQTAPDTDGCECATPNCCGSSCQTVHSNGVGESFYDCAPRGTYNAAEQLGACAAFTGDAAKCTSVSTLCFYVQASVVCSTGASQCYCWYLQNGPAADGGAPIGLVQPSTTSTCMCPALTSATSACTSPGCATWN
jgi:hypothetical protein